MEYEDDEEKPRIVPEVDEDLNNIDEISVYDKLIHAQVRLPNGQTMMEARIKGRKRDAQGCEIETYHDNPIINSKVYEVVFQDGTVKEYDANVIVDNIYSQVDQEDFMCTMFDSIIDFKRDDSAVTHDNKYVTTKRGYRGLRKTTVVWKTVGSME